MNLVEMLLMYAAGCLLGCVFWFLETDRIYCERYPWVGFLLTTLGWPLLVPLSLLALWVNVAYASLRLGLWVCQQIGAKVEFKDGPLADRASSSVPAEAT